MIVEIVVVFALLIGVRLLATRRVKGKVGEAMLSHLLKKLDPQVYRTLNDVYLPLPDGTTTQIDHIVVNTYGFFVIGPAPKCPYFGAPMARHTRRSDGRSFYGCSSYPRCKGIVNIE